MHNLDAKIHRMLKVEWERFRKNQEQFSAKV